MGDLYMSLIHTCELNGVNPFDYLIELQRHAEEMRQHPAEWMPWNYRETLALKCADLPAEPVTPLLDRGVDGLRVAVAGGYFKARTAEVVYAVDRVAAALGANRDIEIPDAERARAAAFVITMSEGGSLHLPRLRVGGRHLPAHLLDHLRRRLNPQRDLLVRA